MNSSAPLPYEVYISSFEDDKTTIAFPLREKLRGPEYDFKVFVDDKDICGGSSYTEERNKAMNCVKVAVLVLCPEFVAYRGPTQELLCFLRRLKEPQQGEPRMTAIIPFYYRSSKEEMKEEPRLDRLCADGQSLFRKSKFLERMQEKEPEATVATIKAKVRKLIDIAGVDNYVDAANDTTQVMYDRRNVLLDKLCEQVKGAMERVPEEIILPPEPPAEGVFRPQFYEDDEASDLILYFDKDTVEAKVLRALKEDSSCTRSIAIQGMGGVGKTSIMSGVSNRKDIKDQFHDGTYWIYLGADTGSDILLSGLCKAVEATGGKEEAMDIRKERNWPEAFRLFRSWFKGKTCLFMVDDVWKTSEVTIGVIGEVLKLHLEGSKSKTLITTRDSDIGSLAETSLHLKPRPAQDPQCYEILMLYSNVPLSKSREEDEKSIKEILDKCDGLPLFIKIAGRAVKSLSLRPGSEGEVAYGCYSKTLEIHMKSYLYTEIDSYQKRLATSLAISIELLQDRKDTWGFRIDLTTKEMHRRLHVLLKHSRVPMNMLRHLWELRGIPEATITARHFDQLAISTMYIWLIKGKHAEILGIHHSLHEYSKAETKEHKEERLGHQVLLEGYGRVLLEIRDTDDER